MYSFVYECAPALYIWTEHTDTHALTVMAECSLKKNHTVCFGIKWQPIWSHTFDWRLSVVYQPFGWFPISPRWKFWILCSLKWQPQSSIKTKHSSLSLTHSGGEKRKLQIKEEKNGSFTNNERYKRKRSIAMVLYSSISGWLTGF